MWFGSEDKRISDNFNSIKITHLLANSAANTNVGVYVVRLASFTADGSDRAVASADGTTSTIFLVDFIGNERAAYFCRAAFLINMGFEFLAEMLQDGDDRNRSALPETAKRGSHD